MFMKLAALHSEIQKLSNGYNNFISAEFALRVRSNFLTLLEYVNTFYTQGISQALQADIKSSIIKLQNDLYELLNSREFQKDAQKLRAWWSCNESADIQEILVLLDRAKLTHSAIGADFFKCFMDKFHEIIEGIKKIRRENAQLSRDFQDERVSAFFESDFPGATPNNQFSENMFNFLKDKKLYQLDFSVEDMELIASLSLKEFRDTCQYWKSIRIHSPVLFEYCVTYMAFFKIQNLITSPFLYYMMPLIENGQIYWMQMILWGVQKTVFAARLALQSDNLSLLEENILNFQDLIDCYAWPDVAVTQALEAAKNPEVKYLIKKRLITLSDIRKWGKEPTLMVARVAQEEMFQSLQLQVPGKVVDLIYAIYLAVKLDQLAKLRQLVRAVLNDDDNSAQDLSMQLFHTHAPIDALLRGGYIKVEELLDNTVRFGRIVAAAELAMHPKVKPHIVTRKITFAMLLEAKELIFGIIDAFAYRPFYERFEQLNFQQRLRFFRIFHALPAIQNLLLTGKINIDHILFAKKQNTGNHRRVECQEKRSEKYQDKQLGVLATKMEVLGRLSNIFKPKLLEAVKQKYIGQFVAGEKLSANSDEPGKQILSDIEAEVFRSMVCSRRSLN